MGLQTLLRPGRPQGFFIPHRYAPAAQRAAEAASHGLLAQCFETALPACRSFLEIADRYADSLGTIGGHGTHSAHARWDQDWFPRLDAVAAYVMARHYRPATIIEVGAGHSTRFFAQGIIDGDTGASLVAIDPAPRADLEALGALVDLSVVRKPLQTVDREVFDSLQRGDIVSIDGSHILMPGTDLAVFLGEIVGGLPKGVRLHIHDVFLPDPYPARWRWRGYNEQQAIAPLITLGAFEIVFASHYLTTRGHDAVAASCAGALPLLPQAPESSLWLEKRV